MRSEVEPPAPAVRDPSRLALGHGLCLAGLSLNRWSLGWLLTESGAASGIEFELEKHIQEQESGAQSGAGRMLKLEVDEEDIAEVVARWTAVPNSA